jgi:hypothetical protein
LNADHLLKERHEQGESNIGISQSGILTEYDLDDGACIFDFLEVKKRLWSTAADVASLLLVGNEFPSLCRRV